jgi:hypothetical protein
MQVQVELTCDVSFICTHVIICTPHRKVAEAELEVSKADCKVAKAELAALKAKDTPASQLAEAER